MPQPTIVLVHGAFAESSSWNGVIRRLRDQGYFVMAAPNPVRGVSADAEFVSSILASIQGPVVLAAHSYGGAVITNAARDNANVEALVFIAGFAPDKGESIGELSARYPGSTLGETLMTVTLPDGSKDLYIRQDRFHAQFCADVPAERAALMAVTQRPLRDVALNEGSGPPAWKSIPSWFLIPELDKNIPAEAHRFMARRAQAREVVEIPGASHAVGVSHPDEVAGMILRAARFAEAPLSMPHTQEQVAPRH
jgi:pimeloyl-ACP methyl ester carboxylesterase